MMEKKIDSHGSLTLTNKRLIHEKNTWSTSFTKEVPLDKIDSISYMKKIDIGIILLGIIFIASEFIFLWLMNYATYLFLIVGLIAVVAGFLRSEEFVEFKSNTETIIEKKKGMDKFTEKVREEVYGG